MIPTENMPNTPLTLFSSEPTAEQPPHSHLHPLKAVKLRPHVQIKVEFPRDVSRLRSPTVEINDVLDPLPAPVDNPVVPVKRRVVAQKHVQPCLGRERGCAPREGVKPWASAPLEEERGG